MHGNVSGELHCVKPKRRLTTPTWMHSATGPLDVSKGKAPRTPEYVHHCLLVNVWKPTQGNKTEGVVMGAEFFQIPGG